MDYQDYTQRYDVNWVLEEFRERKNPNDTIDWTPLINPLMYQKALSEFQHYGDLVQFPEKHIFQWMGIIMKNTAIIEACTYLAGHESYYPYDDIADFFGVEDGKVDYQNSTLEVEENDEIVTKSFDDVLYDNGVYGFMKLPDGSVAWSDYGLRPLIEICYEYQDGMSAKDTLVLVNKALDVTHQSGDLSSAFIQGGKSTLNQISNTIYKENILRNMNNKKIKQIIESQLRKYIREDFEDNQDWRTDMLNANRRRYQAGLPFNMAQDEFRSPKSRKAYQDLADKRFQQARDLTRSAQDKFNKKVVPKWGPEYNINPWKFQTGGGRNKGDFSTTRAVHIQSHHPEDYWVYGDNNPDFRALNNFRHEKSYYDDELDNWVDVGSPDYDEQKAKDFWKNHYQYMQKNIGESIAHRITEQVIKQICEGQNDCPACELIGKVIHTPWSGTQKVQKTSWGKDEDGTDVIEFWSMGLPFMNLTQEEANVLIRDGVLDDINIVDNSTN